MIYQIAAVDLENINIFLGLTKVPSSEISPLFSCSRTSKVVMLVSSSLLGTDNLSNYGLELEVDYSTGRGGGGGGGGGREGGVLT